MRFPIRSGVVLTGAAAFSSLLLIAAAEAQNRPPAHRPPPSSTGSNTGSGAGGEPATHETQRSMRPRRPSVDVIDLVDRLEERSDRSLGSSAAITPGVVTCEAGCDGAPGKVVYAAATIPPRDMPSPMQQVSLADPTINPAPKPFEATCLAGCFDEPAWKHPRNRMGQTPSVVMASLTEPQTPAGAASHHALSPQRRTALKTALRPAPKIAKLAKNPTHPVVHLAAALPPRVASLPLETQKKRPAKRFMSVKKSRTVVRKTRHKIIRPAIKYPPRPLPVTVRVVTAAQTPAHRPGAPIGAFVTTVAYAEPRRTALETPSVADLARRALRDGALRHSLANVSDDWLNKSKRGAAPAIRIQ